LQQEPKQIRWMGAAAAGAKLALLSDGKLAPAAVRPLMILRRLMFVIASFSHKN